MSKFYKCKECGCNFVSTDTATEDQCKGCSPVKTPDLKNWFHTEIAIAILINDEETLENKLNLLTEIGLTASNPRTFELCEKLRNQLCDKEISPGREDVLRDSKTNRHYCSDSGNEELNEMDEE